MSKTIEEQVIEYNKLTEDGEALAGAWIKEALQERDRIAREETAIELKAVFAKFIDEIPEAYGWGEKDEQADFGYRKCSRNVKAMGLKLLQALNTPSV